MNKIVFFGSEDFSLISLEALIDNGFPVAAVVTKPDSAQGRGQKVVAPKIKTYAIEHGIEVWQPVKLAEIADKISALGKPAGILVSYGKIIPQSIIDLFNPGIINIHPSLLPLYRGPSPVEAAILNGDKETGVSIMQLSAAMDAGPVYYQEKVSLAGTETGPELLNSLGTMGAQKLVQILPDILSGELSPEAQEDSRASYCHLIKKTDSVVDWTKPAEQIEREVRAYSVWPQSRTTLNGIEVIIIQAHVEPGNKEPGAVDASKSQLLVGTGDQLLSIDVIKPLGKKEMPITAFLAGYRSQLQA